MIKNRHDPRYTKVMNSAEWRHLRDYVRGRDHRLCQDCLKQGRAVPGAEVHHIEPIDRIANDAEFYRKAYDPNNLVLLCRECHNKRHEDLDKNNPKKKAENLKARCREWLEEFL